MKMTKMREDEARELLREWLQSAYSGARTGCPSPQSFIKAELQEMSPDERAAVEEHASRCPVCAAERELAEAFDAPPEALEARREDINYIISRLKTPTDQRAIAEGTAPRRSVFRTTLLTWAPRVAAAAVLIVAVGILLQSPRPLPPPLPVKGPDALTRGSTLELVYPIGELQTFPLELRWMTVDGAHTYRVRMRTVDGTVLWSDSVTKVTVPLPKIVIKDLESAVLYHWSVDALDAEGVRIAWSEDGTFRVTVSAGK